MNRTELHEKICNELHDTYKRKNADYGNSFAKVREKYPNAILVRLNDKLSRLETLMSGSTQQVSDESIEDSFLDLANYCIMEVVERKSEKPTIDFLQGGHGVAIGKPAETTYVLALLEKVILDCLEAGWIARDSNGYLYYYSKPPRKGLLSWDTTSNDENCVLLGSGMARFNFIKWEDDMPWAVKDLKELPVCEP